MNIREVQHALAVEPELTYVGNDVLIDEDLLTSVCLGLIRLIHHTTQEYFERKGPNSFPDAHRNITTTYLTYLSHHTTPGRSSFGFARALKPPESFLSAYAFLQHTARNGGLVVRGSIGNSLSGFASDLNEAVNETSLRQAGSVFLYASSSMAISISLASGWPYVSICRSRW